MSDRNFTQYFNVVMTSLSSDRKITVQRCYICGERCDCSLTYLDCLIYEMLFIRKKKPTLIPSA